MELTDKQFQERYELTRAISKAQDAISAEAHRIKRPKESVLPLLRTTNALCAAVRAQALFDARVSVQNIDAPRDVYRRLIG